MEPDRGVIVTREDAQAALDELRALTAAGAGWVNVWPEIPVDVEVPATPGVLAVFSKRGPAVPMGTWTAPSDDGRRAEPAQVGIQHAVGGPAVPALADGPARLPAGWRVLQDHPRRGLVVLPDPGASEADVVDWLLRALGLLCRVPQTGRFQVAVYLP